MTPLLVDANDMASLIDVIRERARKLARPCVVALDGRSGAGKSTLAAGLAEALGACVLAGDDFFAGGVAVRSDAPQDRARDCIDWKRQRPVLEALRAGREASYIAFDWEAFDGRLAAKPTVVEPRPIVVFEGVYTARPELSDLVDLRFLLQVGEATRTARLLARLGSISAWERQWHEAEDWYFTHVVPPHAFDVIVREPAITLGHAASARLARTLCDTAPMIAGTCLCGAVRYEVEGPLQHLMHCHCSMCRKHHGAPFATFVQVEQQAFRWLAGEHQVANYASSAARVRPFCEVCGSVAPSPIGDRLLTPAGNLSGDLGVTGGLHMFVGSKAPWHLIADALPQYDAAPPGWNTAVERRAAPSVEGAAHGSCSCGAVSFVVTGEPPRWMQCHCSRCRRGRSSVHGSNAFYPLAQFAWRSGRELVRSYKPPEAERFSVSFCTRCGGGAPVERENVPFVLVPMGLLDTDPGTRPQAHIHVASKASWHAIQDGLPQFSELPP